MHDSGHSPYRFAGPHACTLGPRTASGNGLPSLIFSINPCRSAPVLRAKVRMPIYQLQPHHGRAELVSPHARLCRNAGAEVKRNLSRFSATRSAFQIKPTTVVLKYYGRAHQNRFVVEGEPHLPAVRRGRVARLRGVARGLGNAAAVCPSTEVLS